MTFHRSRAAALAGAGLAALLLAACGQDADEVSFADPTAPAAYDPAPGDDAVRMDVAADEGFITLDGTVVRADPQAFVLDYGAGEVTVEMDDWDWYREGQALAVGDEVTVSGRFDEDLYEQAKVEASVVYVENLQTAYYASPADEETLGASAAMMVHPRNVDVTGRVEAIEGRSFTLDAPTGTFRVDTSALAENPLDAEGAQRIEAGDRVYAWGDLRLAGADSRLMAQGVVSLSADAGPAVAGSGTRRGAGPVTASTDSAQPS